MAARLVVAPEAEVDITEAYIWYERRRVGLGEEFLGSVDACIERISRQPAIYPCVHDQYRRALVKTSKDLNGHIGSSSTAKPTKLWRQ